MTDTLYKVLVDGRSCHGGEMVWSLPSEQPGEWMRYEGKPIICECGIHLTNKFEKWLKVGCKIYEAEAEGIAEWEGDKCVCQAARLIREVPAPDWWIKSEAFVLEEIMTVEWWSKKTAIAVPHRKFKTRKAAREAARDAAWNAAREAARNVVWDAAGEAARNVVWDAAREAARNVVWDAAGEAARNVVWDAAGDAQLKCIMTGIGADLQIAPEHRKYAEDAWSIWKAGYGCLGKVGDEFYVYERP